MFHSFRFTVCFEWSFRPSPPTFESRRCGSSISYQTFFIIFLKACNGNWVEMWGVHWCIKHASGVMFLTTQWHCALAFSRLLDRCVRGVLVHMTESQSNGIQPRCSFVILLPRLPEQHINHVRRQMLNEDAPCMLTHIFTPSFISSWEKTLFNSIPDPGFIRAGQHCAFPYILHMWQAVNLHTTRVPLHTDVDWTAHMSPQLRR